mmetsp:Transcript_70244/g.227435  ORF Transcript_70244/g.227435 Transcript_70244/m.227435 type:complete len:457 (+) Transcript_70244:768-2138(+)
MGPRGCSAGQHAAHARPPRGARGGPGVQEQMHAVGAGRPQGVLPGEVQGRLPEPEPSGVPHGLDLPQRQRAQSNQGRAAGNDRRRSDLQHPGLVDCVARRYPPCQVVRLHGRPAREVRGAARQHAGQRVPDLVRRAGGRAAEVLGAGRAACHRRPRRRHPPSAGARAVDGARGLHRRELVAEAAVPPDLRGGRLEAGARSGPRQHALPLPHELPRHVPDRAGGEHHVQLRPPPRAGRAPGREVEIVGRHIHRDVGHGAAGRPGRRPRCAAGGAGRPLRRALPRPAARPHPGRRAAVPRELLRLAAWRRLWRDAEEERPENARDHEKSRDHVLLKGALLTASGAGLVCSSSLGERLGISWRQRGPPARRPPRRTSKQPRSWSDEHAQAVYRREAGRGVVFWDRTRVLLGCSSSLAALQAGACGMWGGLCLGRRRVLGRARHVSATCPGTLRHRFRGR